MITARIRSRLAYSQRRLDAQYFCAPGVRAAESLLLLEADGIRRVTVADIGTIYHPNRFKRQLAASAEPAMPFLRAFDVFEYLPQAADMISVPRTENIDMLRVEPGVILLTRSGRNLGPAVMVDDHLAKFIPSDDLLRLKIVDERLRHYVFMFLNSPTGQHLLRQDRTGSVIDHLSAGQVGRQSIPIFDDIFDQVSSESKRCLSLRSRARTTLVAAVDAMSAALKVSTEKDSKSGWTVDAASLGTRLDAAFHQKRIADIRRSLMKAGGVRLGDVAEVRKPGGRYKTYYVSEEHGKPLLSGRNLLQVTPIGAKFISERSIATDSGYELAAGWVCCQADGRAEERLGYPIMVTSDRAGWLASGHVARIKAKRTSDAGWIWSAMATDQVLDQVSAIACGSVVDALYEGDLADVVLPPKGIADSARVRKAWEMFAEAGVHERNAVALLEAKMSGTN